MTTLQPVAAVVIRPGSFRQLQLLIIAHTPEVTADFHLQRPGPDQQPIRLNTCECSRAGDLLADFYDSASGGIFAAAAIDTAAQQDLLAAIDKRHVTDRATVV